MEELKIKIKWLKDMIHLHHQLGNKGLEQIFKLRLNNLIVEVGIDLVNYLMSRFNMSEDEVLNMLSRELGNIKTGDI